MLVSLIIVLPFFGSSFILPRSYRWWGLGCKLLVGCLKNVQMADLFIWRAGEHHIQNRFAREPFPLMSWGLSSRWQLKTGCIDAAGRVNVGIDLAGAWPECAFLWHFFRQPLCSRLDYVHCSCSHDQRGHRAFSLTDGRIVSRIGVSTSCQRAKIFLVLEWLCMSVDDRATGSFREAGGFT